MSSRKKGKERKIDPTIIVAIITLIGTLLTLLFTYDPIKKWFDARLNPPTDTPIPSATAVPPIPSDTPVVIPTFTPESASASIASPLPPPSSTPTPDVGVMTAQITYNYASGKAPLHVTFKAFSSYVAHPDGKTETCEFKHVCSYTWDVRLDGATIYGPESGGGEFAYTFLRRGNYTVVVYVCRGEICNFSAVSVTVN